MGYSLCAAEREVIITFDDASDQAKLYTANPVWLRKLDKLVAQNPEQFREIDNEKLEGRIIAKNYEFPKRFITIRSKDIQVELTEDQRIERRQRMKALRSSSAQTNSEV